MYAAACLFLSALQAVSAGATSMPEARLCCQCGKVQQLVLADRESLTATALSALGLPASSKRPIL